MFNNGAANDGYSQGHYLHSPLRESHLLFFIFFNSENGINQGFNLYSVSGDILEAILC